MKEKIIVVSILLLTILISIARGDILTERVFKEDFSSTALMDEPNYMESKENSVYWGCAL